MEKKKNREWVKNAAIIFLAVLLVLTFFSNTIMNRSLPEVATQGVTSGSIVARVRGTGTVTATGANQVKAEKNREIRSVLVKVGQKVEVGDVLFTLGQGTSEDIDAAEEKLRTLQSSYNRTAANAPIYDYSTEWRRMNIFKTKMDEAKKAMDVAYEALKKQLNGKKYDPYSDNAVTQLDYIQEKLNDAITARNAALEDLKSKEKSEPTYQGHTVTEIESLQKYIINQLVEHEDIDGDLLSSEYSDRSKIEVQIQRLKYSTSSDDDNKNETTTIPKTVEDNTTSTIPTNEVNSKNTSKTADSEINSENQSAEISAADNTILSNGKTVDTTIQQEKEKESNSIVSNDIQSIENMNTDSISSIVDETFVSDSKNASISSTSKNEEDKITEDNTSENTNTNNNQNNETKKNLDSSDYPRSPLTNDPSSEFSITASERLERLEEALKKYDQLESWKYLAKVDLTDVKAKYDAAEAEVEKWSDALETALDTGTAEAAVYRAKKAAYEEAKDAYDTAYESLAYSMANDARTASVTGVELSDLNEQIERAKAKLAELTGEDQQITAKVAGTIQTIDTTAGSTVKKDDILCTIEVPDMGYTMSFSVTNDQANRLRPGDTATVSNFYWGNEVTATLNNIKVDPKNPQTNKLLTFDLTGNVTSGSELTISVGQKSANYDIIIPSSAIRTDANGSFVLRVDAKNSPLGNRYIAHRVQVEVLASDDSNSAVTGDLNNGDYVITTSNSPIKSGQMVRLATY